MVFSFRKRAIVFHKDEEVEVSLDRNEAELPEVFITKVASQSSRKLFLHLPSARPDIVSRDSGILMHFKRKSRIGSFRSKVLEVLANEIPPLFSISVPSEVFWEEIVPSRLALKDFYQARGALSRLLVSDETGEFEAQVKRVADPELIISVEREYTPGEILRLTFAIEDKALCFETEVIGCERNDGFEVTISIAGLDHDIRESIAKSLGQQGGAA